MNFEFYLFFLF